MSRERCDDIRTNNVLHSDSTLGSAEKRENNTNSINAREKKMEKPTNIADKF